ncbi:biotin--[acetyl-CoA-carboxylase] ligase [bacterium]|nr:biotin--[acetyl-CoA-carboxylase] ligase [bacterium]
MSIDVQMYRREEVDSTLSEAKRIRTTAKVPFAVVACLQTGGIGRLGRAWYSPIGGLWFTLAWPAHHPVSRYGSLPLVAGVATARVLESALAGTDAAIALKWPNDVLLNDAKVAGLLCQSATDEAGLAFFIGIGINVDFPLDELPTDLRSPATTLANETGAPQSADELAPLLLAELVACVQQYEQEGFAPFLPEVRHRLAWIGQQVTVEVDGEGTLVGTMEGIDEHGRLEIYTGSQRRLIASADVSRVRRA